MDQQYTTGVIIKGDERGAVQAFQRAGSASDKFTDDATKKAAESAKAMDALEASINPAREVLEKLGIDLGGDFAAGAQLAETIMGALGVTFGVVATAAVGLGVIISNNAEEHRKFANAIALTGNAAGITAGQYQDMVDAVGGSTGKFDQAGQILTTLISSGQFTGQVLEGTASIISKISEISGHEATEVTADFLNMTKGVADWAFEHNKTYNFINGAQLAHIAQLEHEGKAQEAMMVTVDALTERFKNQRAELSLWGQFVQFDEKVTGRFVQAIGEAFSDGGLEQQVRKQQALVDSLKTRFPQGTIQQQALSPQIEEETQKLAELTRQRDADTESVQKGAVARAASVSSAAFVKQMDGENERLKQATALFGKGEAAAIRYALAKQLDIDANIKDAAVREQTIAADRAAAASALERAQAVDALTSSLKQNKVSGVGLIKAQADALIAAATNQKALDEKIAEVDFSHGLTAYQTYYSRLAEIENTAYATSSAQRARELVALEGELKRLQGLGPNASEGALQSARTELQSMRTQIAKEDSDHNQKIADLTRAQADAYNDVYDAVFPTTKALDDYDVKLSRAQEAESKGIISAQALAAYQQQLAISRDANTKAIEDSLNPGQAQIQQLIAENAAIAAGTALTDARTAAALKLKGVDPVDIAQIENLSREQRLLQQIFGDTSDPTATLTAGMEDLKNTVVDLSDTWGQMAAQAVTGLENIAKAHDYVALAATKSGKERQAIELKAISTSLNGYAQLTAGAANMFGKNTKGYQVLSAASKAFYAAELVLNLESVAAKLLGIETTVATKVAGDATMTASDAVFTGASIAKSLMRTSVNAVEAVVKAISGLPFPLNLAAGAATAAAIAALGVQIFGGGGGGGGTSAQDQQASQGTGTVLGDSKAKSDSIAKGIEELGKLQADQLGYSQRMLTQLTQINAGINGLGSLLIQANIATGGATPFEGQALGRVGLGGFLSGSFANVLGKYGDFLSVGISKIFDQFGSLGMGLSKILTGPTALGGKLFGAVSNALFGGKQSLRDTGINISGTVGDFDSRYYARIKTDGGLFGSDSYKNKYAALDAQTADQIQKIISGLGDAVVDGVVALGGDAETAKQMLQKMDLDIGNISLKGLSGEEVQKALSAVFSALGDRMASTAGAALANIDLGKFQQVGEGLLQTLSRVAANFEFAQQTADRLHIALVPLTDDFASSADVAGDLLKASIAASETSNGIVSGLGQLVQGYNGTVDDLVQYIQSLYDARKTLREVNIDTAALTATLVNAAGGIDALQSALGTYQDAFFSDSEKAAAKTRTMQAEFAKIGLTLPTSYTDFRKLVDGIDTSSDAGQKLLGEVLSLASGFDDLQKALDSANQAQKQLQDSLNGAIGADDLPEKKLSDLMMQFDNAFAMALSSSGPDLEKQASILNDLIDPIVSQIKSVYASGEQSVELQGYVTDAVNAVIEKLGEQAAPFSAGVIENGQQTPLVVAPPSSATSAPTAVTLPAETNTTLTSILDQMSLFNTHGAAGVAVDQAGFTALLTQLEAIAKDLRGVATTSRLTALAQ